MGRQKRTESATHTQNPHPFHPTHTQQCMRETDDPRKCKERRDDYLECLHHRKEVSGARRGQEMEL